MIIEMMGNSNFGWLPAKELKRYFGNNPKCRLTNHHSRHMARLWHFFTGKWVFWRYWFGLNPSGLAQSKTVLEFVFQKWANFSSSLDGKKKKMKSEFEMEEIHTKKGFPFRFDRKYFFIFYNWSSQNLDFNLSFSTLLPYFFTFFFKNWHVYILVFSLSLFFLIILISSIFFS